MLTVKRQAAIGIYLAIALVALIGTWGNNLHYVANGTLNNFWSDTLDNPASRSITVDLFLLTLAALVWMLFEAHRLQIKGVWLYVLFGGLIAISVTFPLFMAARERAAARIEQGEPAGDVSRLDVALFVVMAAVVIAYTVVTLTR